MSRLLDAPRRQAAAPAPGRRARPAPGRVLAVVAALCALALALCALPQVRYQLRASFTRLPTTYTELYFTREPAFAGGAAVVPVAVVAHGDAPHAYRLRTWLTTAAGHTVVSRTGTLTVRRTGVAGRTTVRLPAGGGLGKPAHVVVHVALVGRAQSLHYSLEGTP